jgi:fucose permease
VLLSFATTNEFAFNTSQTSFRSVMGLLKERNILFSFLSIMLIVGLDVGLNTIAPELLMKKVGLELSRAGLGSSVYFFAKIAGTLVGALMLLKTAPLRFLKISLLIAVIAFVPLMFMSELWVLVAAIFVIGFMCANVFSIIFSFALQNKAERSNEISALMIMGVSGGAVILPLQGYVNDIFGLTASISILMISLLCILLLTRKMTSHAQQ